MCFVSPSASSTCFRSVTLSYVYFSSPFYRCLSPHFTRLLALQQLMEAATRV
jgi:hypothetical protein